MRLNLTSGSLEPEAIENDQSDLRLECGAGRSALLLVNDPYAV